MNRLLVFVIGLLSFAANATCTKSGVLNSYDYNTAVMRFGTINLTSTYFQPVGSLIARLAVPPTNFSATGAKPSTVLWQCDITDLPRIKFLVATNGDDRVGGFWDIGAKDGIPNVFATYYKYIGLKQTMDDLVINRYWQAIPVKNYITIGNKIQIRLQDLPTLYAELYRVSSLPPSSGSGSNYCGGQITTGTYSCTQPNSYIQLSGPGLESDIEGSDSNWNYRFWGAHNGFGYGMRLGNQLYNDVTCVARNATPLVLFNTISANELNKGGAAHANFNVSIECSDKAVSGTSAHQVAIGIQASEKAYNAAQKLGLVNSKNGVAALVADDYGSSGIAQGVGVFLHNSNSSTNINFVGQPGLSGGGALAGWHPAKAGATSIGSTQAGYTQYIKSYSVSLKKLAGQTVTAGKFNSTAYVLVKIQ
ncbi:fimbrial protein [Acinetobacter sp. 'aerobic (ED)']|uniref:fimbrial protein n=1 Tax=Acinetobacter sp. 'aerobic (ED)' TaxID=174230 RepID=UPI00192B8AF3|nr:fimbrial protein [Acinetobacter sp. 'aerobic (ED)']